MNTARVTTSTTSNPNGAALLHANTAAPNHCPTPRPLLDGRTPQKPAATPLMCLSGAASALTVVACVVQWVITALYLP